MALISFVDPKMYQGINPSDSRWDGLPYGGASLSLGNQGRNGDPSITSVRLEMPLDRVYGEGDVLFAGFHAKITNTGSSSSTDIALFTLRSNTGANTSSRRAGLYLSNTVANEPFSIQWRNSSSNILVESSFSFTRGPDEDHFVEVRVVISFAGQGAVQVKLDGITVIDETDVTTADSASIQYTAIERGGTSAHAPDCDVIAVWNDQPGDRMNDWLGPLRTEYRAPDEDVSVDFAPSSGSDNYAMLSSNDEDTTYNVSDVEGAEDLLRVPTDDITVGDILFGRIFYSARKEGEGTTGIRKIVGSEDEIIVSDLEGPGTNYFITYTDCHLNPKTNQLWKNNDDMLIGYRMTTE